ncbi:MAG: hypothetical protein M0R03_11010 [Novosphingobium sp.]|nr:hypothetical protein [Novosphingobium sp.]
MKKIHTISQDIDFLFLILEQEKRVSHKIKNKANIIISKMHQWYKDNKDDNIRDNEEEKLTNLQNEFFQLFEKVFPNVPKN